MRLLKWRLLILQLRQNYDKLDRPKQDEIIKQKVDR